MEGTYSWDVPGFVGFQRGGFRKTPQSVIVRVNMLVGGFNPSEKYESQLGLLFPIYGKNVPNHQPVTHGVLFGHQ